LAKPFLKWAGGKRQLLSALRPFYPSRFGAYREPFLGSAAVFFDLENRELLREHHVHLTDSNGDLIACYLTLRDEPEQVIDELSRLERDHHQRGSAHYYEVRNERFNPERLAASRGNSLTRYTPALAAMFIYLNRTGYNGLFRLNADGAFNVPAGRYARPRICDADNLRRVSAALRLPGLVLAHRHFGEVVKAAEPGDFLYLDPPYAPMSRTANFTSYTSSPFGSREQAQLQQAVIELSQRGCQLVLSNSTATEITGLYATNAAVAAAGLRAHRVPARRAINSKAMGRGPVEEYIISNISMKNE
jgi:DNA adenine methylase